MMYLIGLVACVMLTGCVATQPVSVSNVSEATSEPTQRTTGKLVESLEEVIEPTVTPGRMCSTLEQQYKHREEVTEELRKQFTEDYGAEEAEEYLAGTFYEDFEAASWEGFWNGHYTCARCLANGDVPARYFEQEEVSDGTEK